MDASDVVGLARVATCSRALHGLFSEDAVKASMTHCREASERANLLEAQLNRVVQEQDAALESARVAREQRLEVSRELRAHMREVAVEGGRTRRRVRELEHALAEAKRARVD